MATLTTRLYSLWLCSLLGYTHYGHAHYQARCSCELGFWPNHIEEHCRAARHDTVPLPYVCPIDHYLAPNKLEGSPFLHRERSFLRNPRTPTAALGNSTAAVRFCTDPAACAGAPSRPNEVLLPARPSATRLREALGPLQQWKARRLATSQPSQPCSLVTLVPSQPRNPRTLVILLALRGAPPRRRCARLRQLRRRRGGGGVASRRAGSPFRMVRPAPPRPARPTLPTPSRPLRSALPTPTPSSLPPRRHPIARQVLHLRPALQENCGRGALLAATARRADALAWRASTQLGGRCPSVQL